MSLERVDNDTGYVQGNCVLIAVEFNTPDNSRNKARFEVHGTAQWSTHKVEMVHGLRASEINETALASLIREAQQRPTGRHMCDSVSQYATEVGEKQCSRCREFKPEDSFYPRRQAGALSSYCKLCHSKQGHARRCTLRGCVQPLLKHPRQRAKLRSQPFTLTFDDVLHMLWEQRGRCCYSGVPVNFWLPNSHWRISLERLDNKSGYTRGNCVLVAAEFNSSDYSSRTKADLVSGTAQWSKEKVAQVWGAWQAGVSTCGGAASA